MKKLSFFAMLIFSLVFVFQTFIVKGQNLAPLFVLKENPSAKADKTSIASVRESEIQINFAAFSQNDNTHLRLPLFDGKIYETVKLKSEGFELRAMNDFTWRGKITEGKFVGDVVLTVKKGYISGLIYAPHAVYEIVPKGDKQILVELEQSLFPNCGGEIKGETIKQNPVKQNALATIDSGDRIDVLVFYTTASKNALGGDAQAQTLAQQAVDAANTAYINSKIRQRLRMVNSQEFVYTEVGTPSTDLSNFRNNATVQALRDQYKADLSALIAEEPSVCGIGYLMGADSPASQGNGFTLTHRTCAVGNLSFAHELGHNMGSTHNPENGSSATYPYGFGHYVNGSYRTVMSYVNPCPDGCTRVPYFSNPMVIYSNASTGIDNARDNARSINNTADSIANYRYSGANLMMNNFNGGETLPRNIARLLTWSSDNLTGNVRIEISRSESTDWETLIASTPNDGTQSITVQGRPTRRARLRIVSIDNPAVSDSSIRNFTVR